MYVYCYSSAGTGLKYIKLAVAEHMYGTCFVCWLRLSRHRGNTCNNYVAIQKSKVYNYTIIMQIYLRGLFYDSRV